MKQFALGVGSLYATLVIAFLVAPLFIVAVVSFSSSEFVAFPPDGYSLRWYRQFAQDADIHKSLLLSAEVAVLATVMAMLVALPASIALTRYAFIGRQLLKSLCMSPLILPEVLLGLALLLFIQGELRAAPSFAFLTIGHALIVLPFCVQLLSSSLLEVNPELENAARTLGAGPLRAFIRVVVPGIRGGIASAALFSFIFSFDNVTISLFLAGVGLATLPVQMFLRATMSNDPSLSAISTILIVSTIIVVSLIGRLRGFAGVPDSTR